MRHIEDAYQIAVVQYANLHWWGEFLIHIPNGGKRNIREAARLKKMGVRAGVSDLFLAVPKRLYHGLWIEMKSDKGKETKKQKDWCKSMLANGYGYAVCYTVDEAIAVLDEYMASSRVKAIGDNLAKAL